MAVLNDGGADSLSGGTLSVVVSMGDRYRASQRDHDDVVPDVDLDGVLLQHFLFLLVVLVLILIVVLVLVLIFLRVGVMERLVGG